MEGEGEVGKEEVIRTSCPTQISISPGSGVNEPWVFRGGLVAEFQRLLPSHSLLDFDPLTARPIRESHSVRPLGGAETPSMLASTWTTTSLQSYAVRPYFPFDKVSLRLQL